MRVSRSTSTRITVPGTIGGSGQAVQRRASWAGHPGTAPASFAPTRPAGRLPTRHCAAGYDPIARTVDLADAAVTILVPIRSDRVFYAAPTSVPAASTWPTAAWPDWSPNASTAAAGCTRPPAPTCAP